MQLSERDSRRFFQQIISGVDYCHRHMIVHRYVMHVIVPTSASMWGEFDMSSGLTYCVMINTEKSLKEQKSLTLE